MSSHARHEGHHHRRFGPGSIGAGALAVVAAGALSAGVGLLAPAVAQAADPPPPGSSGPNTVQGPGLIADPTPNKTTPPDSGAAQPEDEVGGALEACAGSGIPDAAPACDFIGKGRTALQGAMGH